MVSVWSTINRGKYHHMALTHRVQYAYIVHVEYCACWILCWSCCCIWSDRTTRAHGWRAIYIGPAVVCDLTEGLGTWSTDYIHWSCCCIWSEWRAADQREDKLQSDRYRITLITARRCPMSVYLLYRSEWSIISQLDRLFIFKRRRVIPLLAEQTLSSVRR